MSEWQQDHILGDTCCEMGERWPGSVLNYHFVSHISLTPPNTGVAPSQLLQMFVFPFTYYNFRAVVCVCVYFLNNPRSGFLGGILCFMSVSRVQR